MSYGRWKAMQVRKEQPKAKPKPEGKKATGLTCTVCGGEILHRTSMSGNQRKKYCSEECANAEKRRIKLSLYYKKKERMMADGKI